MKSDKGILLTSVVIAMLIFLIGCSQPKAKEPEYPLNGPIPQSDIVFMPDSNPEQVSREFESKTLGFIDADGSNRREYTFTLFGGASSNFGMPLPSQVAQYPRWSMNGDKVAFSIRNTAPNMRLIDRNGRMYGKNCTDIRTDEITFDSHGNALIRIGRNDQVYEDYKNMTSTAPVARYDIKTCRVVSVFSVPVPFESLISEIQEAENGLLVASFWNTDAQMHKILIYGSNTEGAQTLSGYHPSLTKDGAMLAYYNRYGWLVIIDMATGEEKRLLPVIPLPVYSYESLVGMPGWSPDNQWLVYNTPKGDIFKVNIETGENVYLTYGWAPDWRWRDGP